MGLIFLIVSMGKLRHKKFTQNLPSLATSDKRGWGFYPTTCFQSLPLNPKAELPTGWMTGKTAHIFWWDLYDSHVEGIYMRWLQSSFNWLFPEKTEVFSLFSKSLMLGREEAGEGVDSGVRQPLLPTCCEHLNISKFLHLLEPHL